MKKEKPPKKEPKIKKLVKDRSHLKKILLLQQILNSPCAKIPLAEGERKR
jgi:hypothetical protein